MLWSNINLFMYGNCLLYLNNTLSRKIWSISQYLRLLQACLYCSILKLCHRRVSLVIDDAIDPQCRLTSPRDRHRRRTKLRRRNNFLYRNFPSFYANVVCTRVRDWSFAVATPRVRNMLPNSRSVKYFILHTPVPKSATFIGSNYNNRSVCLTSGVC